MKDVILFSHSPRVQGLIRHNPQKTFKHGYKFKAIQLLAVLEDFLYRKDVCTRQQENHFSGVHHVFRNSAQSCSVVEVPVQYLNTQENEQLQLLEIKTDIEFFDCKIGL